MRDAFSWGIPEPLPHVKPVQLQTSVLGQSKSIPNPLYESGNNIHIIHCYLKHAGAVAVVILLFNLYYVEGASNYGTKAHAPIHSGSQK